MKDRDMEFVNMPPVENGQTIHLSIPMTLDEGGWRRSGIAHWWITNPEKPDEVPPLGVAEEVEIEPEDWPPLDWYGYP